MSEPLLDVQAVAVRLSASARTVERLIRKPAVPLWIRGHRRISPASGTTWRDSS